MEGKNILVAGLGRTGIATANRLCSMGNSVTVTDSKPKEQLKEQIEKLDTSVKTILGGVDGMTGVTFDLVVTSPGIDWGSPMLSDFRKAGVEVISEIELAFRLSGNDWIAITGTNGKTTTTSMVGAILAASGMPHVVCGNIGNPAIGEDRVFSDNVTVVAEISSFQLEGVVSFAPRVSAILNITPDHLDRHGTLKNYGDIKSRIFARQNINDVCVLNMDDPLASSLAKSAPSKVLGFSAGKVLEEGAFVEKGRIVVSFKGDRFDIGDAGKLKVLGKPNLENALAACAIAIAYGAGARAVTNAIFSFTGIPHRMEVVAVRKGVVYINDSKGTNVSATLKALEGIDTPVKLILGGRDKEGDFSPLVEMIREKRASVFLIGEASDKIADALGVYPDVSRADSLEDAVAKASSRAVDGDTVLLSPACASFDMFRNYEDRGERFREAVLRLDPGKEALNHA